MISIKIPEGVTTIDDCTFCGCINLANVTIPDSVTSIVCTAFDDTRILREQKGPLYSIDGWVMTCDKNTTSVNIPNGTRGIAYAAFEDCKKLFSVTIPEGVMKIDEETFSGCTSLTFLTIPSSVTEIGWAAFLSCLALKYVDAPASIVTEIEEQIERKVNLTQSEEQKKAKDSICAYYEAKKENTFSALRWFNALRNT